MSTAMHGALTTLGHEEMLTHRGAADPIVYQRRVSNWLNSLIGSAGARAEVPLKVDGAASVAPFEALRAWLHQSGGQALADLDLVQNVVRRFGDAPLSLAGREGRRVAKLARLAGYRNISAAEPVTFAERLRVAAYVGRRELRGMLPRRELTAQQCFALIVPRMPGHLADLMPVAAALEKTGRRVVFATDVLGQRVRAAGFAAVPHNRGSGVHGVRLGFEIRQRIEQVVGPARRAGPPADRVLAAVVGDEAKAQSVRLARVALGLCGLLRTLKPKIVVVGNPYTMEGRIAALLASGAGVPSAALEHGTIFGNDPVWERYPVSVMLVRGEAGRRALLANAVRPEQICVVGAPRLDAVVTRARTDRPRSVLVASSGGGDQVSHSEHHAFIELIYAAAESTQGVEWVVKLHPKDQPALYAIAARQHPSARVTLHAADRSRVGTDIYDFLSRTSVLVTVLSSTALDAMAMGVPVISVLVDPEAEAERRKRVEFLVRDTVTRVRNKSELVAAVLRKLDDGAADDVDARARAYADEQFCFRGHAAEKAAEALIALGETGVTRGC